MKPATVIPAKNNHAKTTSITTFNGIPSTKISEMLSINYTDSLNKLMNSPERASRFIQVISTIIKKNKQLQDCSINSIVGGMLQAAMLNLDFNPSLGECYLVPYKGEAQFQLGYRGFLTLAHRGEQIIEIYAEVVYEDDVFIVEYGLHRDLKHEPKFLHLNDISKITFVYAVAKTKNGGTYFKILSKNEIESLRRRSPSQRNGISGAWATDYPAMAMAKAIKQLSKFLPLSTEYNYAIASDGMIVKSSNTANPAELSYTDEAEIEESIAEISNTEIIDNAVTDDEYFKQNEAEILAKEKELFEQGK